MDYADAVNAFEDEVDRAASAALDNGLSHKEIADELRRIAQDWEDSA